MRPHPSVHYDKRTPEPNGAAARHFSTFRCGRFGGITFGASTQSTLFNINHSEATTTTARTGDAFLFQRRNTPFLGLLVARFAAVFGLVHIAIIIGIGIGIISIHRLMHTFLTSNQPHLGSFR